MVRSRWLCPMLGRVQCSARGWTPGFFGKANSRQKRGPAAVKTPPWRAERRGHSGNGMLTHGNNGASLGAPHPRLFLRDAKTDVGLPGAANNTGDGPRLRSTVVPAQAGTHTPGHRILSETEVVFL